MATAARQAETDEVLSSEMATKLMEVENQYRCFQLGCAVLALVSTRQGTTIGEIESAHSAVQGRHSILVNKLLSWEWSNTNPHSLAHQRVNRISKTSEEEKKQADDRQRFFLSRRNGHGSS